jgi:hypothetical protein
MDDNLFAESGGHNLIAIGKRLENALRDFLAQPGGARTLVRKRRDGNAQYAHRPSGGANSGGKYTTNAGFDEVTGIGVPNVANLLLALVSQALPAPTISSFTPPSGVVNASITITGTNFSSISAVNFNGTSASFSVVSSTQINALVPPGATNGPISVTNPTGTAVSSTNFTVTNGAPAPSISGFSPTNGTVGDSIIISGANFNSVSAVTFNGAAASFTVNSTSQITALVPAAASTGKISVQTPAGTAMSAIEFIFNAPPSTSVVISQIYGGGGNNGATYTNDFVELFNLGTTTIDLSTWSVQYASSTGSTWLKTNLSGMLQPGHYYLVQLASGGANGIALPAANATGTTNISASKGKLALVNNQTALTSCGDSSLGIVDEVGYGTGTDCFEGNAVATGGSNTLAVVRLNAGCTDTNNNNSDFTTAAPAPRNASSPVHNCTSPDLTLTNTHSGNFKQGDKVRSQVMELAGKVAVADKQPER